MKLLFRAVYLILCLMFLVYVIFPSPDFPEPPNGAVQSLEPADTETPLRRAYFVNMTRDDVMTHYKNEFSGFLTLNLNYPPEEAQSIIRDQTRSYYLEELVHPFRESLYVNGFVPQKEQDTIFIDGVVYDQKITIRYVPSLVLVRVLYVGLVLVFSYIVIFNFAKLSSDIFGWIWKLFK